MVQTCVFCKKNVLRYPDLSFHSFPKNGYRKKIWLHNLGLENTKYWHRVCSNHFEARDFKFYTSKLRVLNNKAVPHLNIDKQICYNTIETKNDENVSTSNEVKDVESDTNLTLEHNISSPTTSERYFYNTIYILYLALFLNLNISIIWLLNLEKVMEMTLV